MSARTGGILIGLLAVALLGFAIFSVARIADLEDQVNAVEGQAATLAKATGSGKELQTLEHKLRKIEACIPEVQNEINGLGVEVEAGYAYIENNSQVSTYCQSVVYPQSQEEP